MTEIGKRRVRARRIFGPLVRSIATLLSHFGVSPNAVTVFAALLATFTPILMSRGEYLLFGITVFLVGFLDGVDGAIAKLTNRVTKWGGFLDSVLDRYGDSIIILSYLFNPIVSPLGGIGVLGIDFRIWICVAITGSLMVSYSRAKSEAVGISDSDIGIAARSERLLILSVSSVLGVIDAYVVVLGLVIVAVLANVTVVQRAVHTWRALKSKEKPPRHRQEDRLTSKTKH